MAVKYRKGMKAKIKRNIDNLKREFPSDLYPKVLDVGSKEGYGVYWFRKYGYNALGIEVDKEYISQNTVIGNFLEMNIPDSWDIIFSRHSLEHIELENENGTERFFDRCNKMLRPGGIIYLIVPIGQWWEFFCKGESKLNGFEYLVTMIKLAGFEIIKERCRENALLIGEKR